MSNCCDDNLIRQINELRALIMNSAYQTPLNGLEFFLPQNKHKLTRITGYWVYNKTTGVEVKVEFKIWTDKSITIYSNVLLDDHILILS